VIGPNADSLEALLGNYNGVPSKWVTPLEGIKRKVLDSTKVLDALGTTLTSEVLCPFRLLRCSVLNPRPRMA
jgi:beta-glucosidase